MKSKSILGKVKVLSIVFIIAIIGLGVLYFTGNSRSPEGKLEAKLEVVAKDFYENMYHGHVVNNKNEQEVTDFFIKFIEIGIKVDLDNLSRYDDEKYPNLLEEFKNTKTGEMCNVRNTKAIVYPTQPFGEKDYTLEVQLDCGFE